MKWIKGLELISVVELVFGICLRGAINIIYTEILMEVKEAISKPEEQNESIKGKNRDANFTIWYKSKKKKAKKW